MTHKGKSDSEEKNALNSWRGNLKLVLYKLTYEMRLASVFQN